MGEQAAEEDIIVSEDICQPSRPRFQLLSEPEDHWEPSMHPTQPQLLTAETVVFLRLTTPPAEPPEVRAENERKQTPSPSVPRRMVVTEDLETALRLAVELGM